MQRFLMARVLIETDRQHKAGPPTFELPCPFLNLNHQASITINQSKLKSAGLHRYQPIITIPLTGESSKNLLKRTPLKIPPDILDRGRAVLRRSEPSSRTALTGEQPDPWELLHPQDAMQLILCFHKG